MNTPSLEAAVWRKSTYSGQGGDCVEVADGVPNSVPVRDTKAASGPVLTFSRSSWVPFIAAIRATSPTR